MFNPQKMKLSLMCNGDRQLPIKFEVFSSEENGSDKQYGETVTTVAQLLEGKKEHILTKKTARGGNLIVDQFTVIEMPNFMEYLRSGWCINLSVAIDYTASNGDVVDKTSLHFQDPTGRVQNQYEQALLSVGRVVEPYAMD